MKGIILAGGTGSRLYPATIAISKQLIPVYDKPMIYYPISVLMLAGIREILIITTPHDRESFLKLLGDGSDIGCSFSFETQENPNGLAEAFIIGETFIGNDSVALILGDNILYGSGLGSLLRNKVKENRPTIFAIQVQDPERYGVVEFNNNGDIISVEEKPIKPRSSFAIPGLYFYPNNVIEIAKNIKPSKRGEIEITSINNYYLKNKELKAIKLPRGITWLDTGTPQSLADANEFVKVIENRTGQKIACLEEIAYLSGYISLEELKKCIIKYGNSQYSKYLLSI
ncbi:MAG: glucose-1-phosphate thymidylyltransferase [Flavobacteriaceae bacterium]|nr:glucose-1-phosphate thymidylyltransferase [Flavobacteriaceae bacterium]|tara:strand:- start:2143 stop:2997 length:855 start_codon:yes stop_codon:yes gene_type:complete